MTQNVINSRIAAAIAKHWTNPLYIIASAYNDSDHTFVSFESSFDHAGESLHPRACCELHQIEYDGILEEKSLSQEKIPLSSCKDGSLINQGTGTWANIYEYESHEWFTVGQELMIGREKFICITKSVGCVGRSETITKVRKL